MYLNQAFDVLLDEDVELEAPVRLFFGSRATGSFFELKKQFEDSVDFMFEDGILYVFEN